LGALVSDRELTKACIVAVLVGALAMAAGLVLGSLLTQ
jgi:hypothetical protein